MRTTRNLFRFLMVAVVAGLSAGARIYLPASGWPTFTAITVIAAIAIIHACEDPLVELVEAHLMRRNIAKRQIKPFGIRSKRFSSLNKSLDILALTALNYDSIYRIDSIEPDEEYVATESDKFAGGSGANTAYILSRFGHTVALSGVVGSADIGARMLRELDEVGIDTSGIRQIEAQSGQTAILTDKRGQRVIAVLPGANLHIVKIFEDGWDVKLKEKLASTRILHVSSFAQHSKILAPMQKLIGEMPSSSALSFVPGGIQSSYGLNDPYNALLCSRADCLFFYEKQFTQMLTETSDLEFPSSASLEKKVALFLKWRVKRGYKHPVLICIKNEIKTGLSRKISDYLTVFIGDDEYVTDVCRTRDLPAISSHDVYDATGAGDAAAAGVLSILLSKPDASLSEIITKAFDVSIAVGGRLGPRSGIEKYIGKKSISSGEFSTT
jgi:sugar/nucleoside kinase (ribokinase family)